MSQRATCPVCRDWEILTHDSPRGADWKCSKCGATTADCPDVVIRFGNHYLCTDALRVDGRGWDVTDPFYARHFPFDDAERFRLEMLRANKAIELFEPGSAVEMHCLWKAEKYRREWVGRFEHEVYLLAHADGKPIIGGPWTYYVPSLGCSRVMFQAQDYYAMHLEPHAAAAKFYAENKPWIAT